MNPRVKSVKPLCDYQLPIMKLEFMLESTKLHQKVSQLPPLEKLCLAELLLIDLDKPDSEITIIWQEEAQKRWHSYKNGGLKTISYEFVMKKYQ